MNLIEKLTLKNITFSKANCKHVRSWLRWKMQRHLEVSQVILKIKKRNNMHKNSQCLFVVAAINTLSGGCRSGN